MNQTVVNNQRLRLRQADSTVVAYWVYGKLSSFGTISGVRQGFPIYLWFVDYVIEDVI